MSCLISLARYADIQLPLLSQGIVEVVERIGPESITSWVVSFVPVRPYPFCIYRVLRGRVGSLVFRMPLTDFASVVVSDILQERMKVPHKWP